MEECLKLKTSNCKNCYKCIRHCPVKSIRFSSDQANIVTDECILCGQCFVACPQNAKEIRNDVWFAEKLLLGEAPVYASIAPSFIANYDGVSISSMKSALLKLGFSDVEETAIGATIVKKQYDEMVMEEKNDIIISSCCHSINVLIQKYYPEALPYLAHVLSPIQAHSKAIKLSHPDAKVVFIGPCISKKAEAENYPDTIDCVLTFEELSNWLREKNITLEKKKDHAEQSKARLFPTTGGILRTMEAKNPDYHYIAIDGVENCIGALKDVIGGKLSHCFIEMSACEGSCIGGPAMDKSHRHPVTDFVAVDSYAGASDFEILQPNEQQLYKEMPFIGLHKQMPGTRQIEEILHKMGKTRPEQELNCGSCGYNTCREKAIAVLQGKADLSMCLPYLKERAESFSDNIINNTPNGIIVLNESLEVQQINAAACHIMNIKNPKDVLGSPVVRILEPQIFFEAMEEKQLIHERRAYLAEYQRYVMQTVIYDEDYHIIISIFRDVTNEEMQRTKKEALGNKTIEITNKVIEKQMRAAQEIASLLGETTAETKIALTKLKESLGNE